MTQLSICIILAVLSSSAIVTAQEDAYIFSWINKYLLSQGVYFYDPNPNQTLPLAVNNLKPMSLDNAKYYIYFAFISYCAESRRNWSCTYCQILGKDVHYDSEVSKPFANTLAYFAYNHVRKEIVLAFRGAFNVANLLHSNANGLVPLSAIDTSDIRVHAGFLSALQTLYPQVVARLRKLTKAYPNYKVVVTGHSLGASEAALAVFKFHREGLFPNTTFELYTFGEPRTGNLAFATAFNEMNVGVARVVQRAEYAAHTPALYRQGYVHHQNEVWDVGNSDVRFCNRTVYEDPNCSNSQGPIYSILDHLFYFDIDVAKCGFDDPVATILQTIVDLNGFIPKNLRRALRLNAFRIPLKYRIILRPLGIILGKK